MKLTLFTTLALLGNTSAITIRAPASASASKPPTASGAPSLPPTNKTTTIPNTYNNTYDPLAPETIHNTPLPSPSLLNTTHLTTFCPQTAQTANLCAALQDSVHNCVTHKDACSDGTTRSLLRQSLALNPCGAVQKGEDLKRKVCSQWVVAAKRCRDKTRRGKCGSHHVLYLLRSLRDFLGLPDGAAGRG